MLGLPVEVHIQLLTSYASFLFMYLVLNGNTL